MDHPSLPYTKIMPSHDIDRNNELYRNIPETFVFLLCHGCASWLIDNRQSSILEINIGMDGGEEREIEKHPSIAR